jgi:(5-formylfuran-3-yl)methyl phosphate synthase
VSLLSPRFFRPKSRSRSASDARARRPAARVPALLVSVRNALEARAAVVGGCDLLDVKEPARGPLGMADRPMMAAIAEFAAGCRGTATPLPCSAALGELVDWESRRSEPAFAVPAGIGYLKLGAAGIASAERWIAAWRLVQSRLETPAGSDVQWVAVAYADWRQAESLEPSQMLAAARAVNCSVLLLDTFDKRSGNLLEVTDCSTLRRLVGAARQVGLKIALAGGLRRGQLAELAELGPDLVGVRSAACAGGRRTNPISAGAVRALKRELIATFAADSEP